MAVSWAVAMPLAGHWPFFEHKRVLMIKIKLVTPLIHLPDTQGTASLRCFSMTWIWPGLITLLTTAQFLFTQNWSSDELHFIHHKALSLHLSAQHFLNTLLSLPNVSSSPSHREAGEGQEGEEIPITAASSSCKDDFSCFISLTENLARMGCFPQSYQILDLHLTMLTVKEENIVWLMEISEADRSILTSGKHLQ